MSASLLGLFGVSFLAATLLPAQSELGLSGLIALGTEPVVLLVAAASLGNTLGSMVNWVLGRAATAWSTASWFPVKPDKLAKATGWYHRYGRWSLLLSWAPIIGDPLTLAAGVLKEPFWSFTLLVAIAKTARYVAVALITLQVI
ncbi:Inner membrane protein YqaA [Labrenzia sp. THAF191b]|mgnify:FL=1|uniref:YqaA family protein n=1 Tax=unclassified Labrenzia TaxID=2648686 RepID=UPI00126862DD|nr:MULTISPECIES: YqaA family protein [unclassified Labrenzia]QFS97525.1 Inner membrane protein YqaA [Labrenzia sp. THAF191b]QFT03840.1 Inner membrane protein YqaA [Labrenzia sp. THAF191a]QFT15382.1 Inner membrane protein YqaA [Labrenzia sp. THAF187b]